MVNIPHHSATNFLSVFYSTTLEIFEHLCLMTSHTYYWNIFISITDNSSHFSIMNTKFRLWILWLLAYFQMSLLPARWRHKVSWRTFNCSHNDKTPYMRSRRALVRCFTLRFTLCSWYNPTSLEREASFDRLKSSSEELWVQIPPFYVIGYVTLKPFLACTISILSDSKWATNLWLPDILFITIVLDSNNHLLKHQVSWV